MRTSFILGLCMFVSRRARRDARHRREDRQARDQVVRRRHRVPARVGTLTGWRKVYIVSGVFMHFHRVSGVLMHFYRLSGDFKVK